MAYNDNVMIGYFRPRWNFKFEKFSIGWWLKSQKSDWRIRINFGFTEFEIFYWPIKQVEFFVSRQLYDRNFLG